MSSEQVGRYQLRGEIGRGGMAVVHLAFDPNSNREVAIKLLPPEMLFSPEFRARFKQEVETISTLEHPHIVPVYDSGEEDGQPYFVMRHMKGGSLAARLKHSRFSLTETAEIVEKLAQGLDYAHARKIIHRDIKPENVLFDSNDLPYLTDFGVAKLIEAASSDTGSRFVGSSAYASPEQAQGENDKIDRRTDVYGLGVLVYQMLTGRQPFSSDTTMGMLVQHINEPAPNILDADPDLPPALEVIIKTAMAKKREDRYQSVLEFAQALTVAAFGPDRTAPSSLALERKRLASSARKRTTLMIGGAVLLIALAGAYFSSPIFAPPVAPTVTPSLNPTATLTVAPTESPSPTATIVPVQKIPSPTPTPNGGADQIAYLSGNDLYIKNMDGSGGGLIRTDNYSKSNLQWIPGNRLVYMSQNCAYAVDGETKENEQIICFNPNEPLEGFRVSPDGSQVAITVQHTLNILPFDIEALKQMDTRVSFRVISNFCFYYQFSFRDVLWSEDGKRLAARVVDTELTISDQIFLLDVDIPNCANVGLTRIDKFPGLYFSFSNKVSTNKITSFDWDGDHRFLLNDSVRNNGFGDLYLYDNETHQPEIINPIDGKCCYRDARWSPDGKYILFLYQNQNDTTNKIELYYIPFDELVKNKEFTPIQLFQNVFKRLDKPQPALRPASGN